MNWAEIQAAVLTGNYTGYLPDWPSPLGLVLYQGAIWLADDNYVEVFSPTADQMAATDWQKKPYDGDLPPR